MTKVQHNQLDNQTVIELFDVSENHNLVDAMIKMPEHVSFLVSHNKLYYNIFGSVGFVDNTKIFSVKSWKYLNYGKVQISGS